MYNEKKESLADNIFRKPCYLHWSQLQVGDTAHDFSLTTLTWRKILADFAGKKSSQRDPFYWHRYSFYSNDVTSTRPSDMEDTVLTWSLGHLLLLKVMVRCWRIEMPSCSQTTDYSFRKAYTLINEWHLSNALSGHPKCGQQGHIRWIPRTTSTANQITTRNEAVKSIFWLK